MHAMTYDEFRALRRFPALDGLRAVAALMVVAFHFGGTHWSWLSGWSGVHIFFVLSGFLITTLALREEDRSGRISFRNFYLRRLFRIVPVYLVVLAITMVVFAPPGEPVGDLNGALPYYLTFLNEWAPPSEFLHSWTLGIEQKFYLVWPVLAFAAGALTLARRLTVAAGAMALVCLGWVLWDGSLVHYLVILSGCALAILMHSPRGFALVRPLTHPVTGIVLALVFVAAQLGLRDAVRYFDSEQIALLPYALLTCLMLPGLLTPGPTQWLLSTRPAVFVGERSYSMYLVQAVAGKTFAWALPHVVGFPVAIPPGTRLLVMAGLVALAMAHVLYRVVERPFIRFGTALTKRRPTTHVADRPAESGGTVEPVAMDPVDSTAGQPAAPASGPRGAERSTPYSPGRPIRRANNRATP